MMVSICGATGGVGSAIAREFALHGYDLILLGRTQSKLERLRQELISDHSVAAMVHECDIEKRGSVEYAIDRINSDVSNLDVLVNSSGVFPIGEALKVSQETYNKCLDVNLRLPFLLAKGLFGLLKNQSGGKVINIGSSSSLNGFKNTAIYCASKHALLGLSRALNDEWKGLGCTVHCICPGTIDTQMAEPLDQDPTTYITSDEFAKLVFDISQYQGNMMIPEISVSRREIR